MVGRNKEQEQEILNWIEAVIGEKLPAGAYEDVLRDGVILCRLINKIAPGSVNKIQTSGGSFKLMENIQRFQASLKKYGVPEEEIFQTADLYERRNIPQVTLCIYALARLVSTSSSVSLKLQIITENNQTVGGCSDSETSGVYWSSSGPENGGREQT